MAMKKLLIPVGIGVLAVVALLMLQGFACCGLLSPCGDSKLSVSATPVVSYKPPVTTISPRPTMTYIPSPGATIMPTYLPSPGATIMPTITPTPGGTFYDAVIVDSGTTKTTYNRGETAEGWIKIRNTGDKVITEVMLGITASRKVPFLGYVQVGYVDYPFGGLNIMPGETGEVRFSQEIPADYQGISTAGDYRIAVKVTVGDKNIGSIQKDIIVV